MAYKSIFRIGTTRGKKATIPLGINGGIKLTIHSLRLPEDSRTKDAYGSNIDPKRSHLNMYFNKYSKKWKIFNTKQERGEKLDFVKHQQEKIIEPFYKQYLENKDKRLAKKEKTRESLQSFERWMKNKQPIGEWILSGSRDWFERNEVIKILDKQTFIVKNKAKLLQWANTVNDWAKEQVNSFYGEKSYLNSFLHLDESNIHIHFNYFRAKKIWNIKENRMAWSFTNNGFLTSESIKDMQKSYRSYQNKILFQEYGWDKNLKLEKTQSGKSYSRLDAYKLEQYKNELAQAQLQQEKQKQ